MKILVFSHKECWKSSDSPSGWATDGGFVFHMQAIASLADELEIVCYERKRKPDGEVFFKDPKLSFSTIELKPYSGVKRKLWVLYLAFSRLRFFMRKIREADMVHTPIPSDLATIAMVLSKWMKKPLFIRHCGNWKEPKTKAEFFWKDFMEKNAGNNVLCLATGGASNAPSEVNPNIKWIFSSSLLKGEMEKPVRPLNSAKTKKTVRLIVVSRQSYHKGAGRTLAALSVLKQRGIHAEFTIVGDGDYLDDLKKLVAELGLTGQVSFLGQVGSTEVINQLRQADLFVFPTTAPEGFPKSVLEAMSVGLPVITSRVSVLPELVGKTDSGFALEELSPEAIADAIQTLALDEAMHSRFSNNAYKKAQEYTLEKWADTISDHLNTTFDWSLTRSQEILK